MSRLGPAALAAALALAAPAPALAQSAGDDQYRDPFAGQDPGPEDESSTPPSGNDGTAGDTQEGTGTAPAAPAQSTPQDSTVTLAELPRTGPAAGVVAVIGVLLVGAGLALRRKE